MKPFRSERSQLTTIAVRDQYMRNGAGFLCVFAITLRSSYDEAIKLYDHILEVKDVRSPSHRIANYTLL